MYVYFVSAVDRSPLIKIGKAKNPDKRLMQLQIGSPLKLKMIGAIRCKSDFHATQMERLAHNIFYKQRRHGEWFHLSQKHESQIQSLIARANEEHERQSVEKRLDREIDWNRLSIF